MGDLGGGFYVSRVDTEDYEPDDEDGGLVHMLFEDGETAAGLWKPDPDPAATYEGLVLAGRETIVVLKGSVRIDVEDGPTLELAPATSPRCRRAPSRPGTPRPTSRRSGSSPRALDSWLVAVLLFSHLAN